MVKRSLFQYGMAFLACLFLFAGSAFAQNWLVRTSYSNDATVTIPNGVTAVKAEGWGGGGAGGYVSGGALNYQASGAGGGGAYAADIIPVTSGNAVSISVGIAGQNSSSSSSIKDGGNTVVTYGGTTYVLAAGGKSVTGTNNTTGAQGGQASDCTGKDGWKYSGGKGGNGYTGVCAGSGGAAADNCGNGGNGTNAYIGAINLSGGTPPSCTDALAGKGGNGRTGASGPTAGSTFGGGGSGVVSATLGYRQRTGGAGAKGGVRLTYIVFDVNDGTAPDPICSGSAFTFTPTGTIPTGATYTWTVVPNSNVTVTGNGTTPASNITVGSITNNTTSNQTVTFNCTASYTDSEYGFGTLTREFTVTVTVYGKLDGGTIAETQFVCQNQDIQTLTSVQDATGGQGNGSYQWWQKVHLDENNMYVNGAWAQIDGAIASVFTPELNGQRYFKREYKNDACGSVFSNELQITTVNPLDMGSFNFSPDTICSNISEPFTKHLEKPGHYSPGFDSDHEPSVYWQKSTDKGNTWTDLTNCVHPNLCYYEYDINIAPGEVTAGDDIWYRYAFKFAGCDSVPSNGIYKLHVKDIPDYSEQLKDLDITLWYGACDTTLQLPVLEPTPKSLVGPSAADFSNLTPGLHTFTWVVTDFCDIPQTYIQKVNVSYPECGGVLKDAYGNEYATVRIGCECWMAENLRTNAPDAVYYDEDPANEQFGMLYTWADAVGCNATPKETKSGATYVQGILPDEWAVPTMEQYSKLLQYFNTEELKSDEVGSWLPDNLGTNASGFNMKAGGFYDVTFQRMLGYADFWTAGTNPSDDTKAPVAEVRYDCDGTINCVLKQKMAKMSLRGVRVSPK